MSDDTTDFDVTEAMIRYGGSFVKALGQLYRLGDPFNQGRLRHAFSDYFDRYQRIATAEHEKTEGP